MDDIIIYRVCDVTGTIMYRMSVPTESYECVVLLDHLQRVQSIKEQYSDVKINITTEFRKFPSICNSITAHTYGTDSFMSIRYLKFATVLGINRLAFDISTCKETITIHLLLMSCNYNGALVSTINYILSKVYQHGPK